MMYVNLDPRYIVLQVQLFEAVYVYADSYHLKSNIESFTFGLVIQNHLSIQRRT